MNTTRNFYLCNNVGSSASISRGFLLLLDQLRFVVFKREEQLLGGEDEYETEKSLKWRNLKTHSLFKIKRVATNPRLHS